MFITNAIRILDDALNYVRDSEIRCSPHHDPKPIKYIQSSKREKRHYKPTSFSDLEPRSNHMYAPKRYNTFKQRTPWVARLYSVTFKSEFRKKKAHFHFENKHLFWVSIDGSNSSQQQMMITKSSKSMAIVLWIHSNSLYTVNTTKTRRIIDIILNYCILDIDLPILNPIHSINKATISLKRLSKQKTSYRMNSFFKDLTDMNELMHGACKSKHIAIPPYTFMAQGGVLRAISRVILTNMTYHIHKSKHKPCNTTNKLCIAIWKDDNNQITLKWIRSHPMNWMLHDTDKPRLFGHVFEDVMTKTKPKENIWRRRVLNMNINGVSIIHKTEIDAYTTDRCSECVEIKSCALQSLFAKYLDDDTKKLWEKVQRNKLIGYINQCLIGGVDQLCIGLHDNFVVKEIGQFSIEKDILNSNRKVKDLCDIQFYAVGKVLEWVRKTMTRLRSNNLFLLTTRYITIKEMVKQQFVIKDLSRFNDIIKTKGLCCNERGNIQSINTDFVDTYRYTTR